LMEVSAVCGGFLLLQYLLKVALEMRLSALSMLGVGALSAAGSAVGLLLFLRVRGIRWLREIETRLWRGRVG
jgi:hypothetical protein